MEPARHHRVKIQPALTVGSAVLRERFSQDWESAMVSESRRVSSTRAFDRKCGTEAVPRLFLGIAGIVYGFSCFITRDRWDGYFTRHNDGIPSGFPGRCPG